MLMNILVSLSGIIIFLFVFWKRLKEDYATNQIFTTAFYVLSGVGLGYFTSRRFLPNAWFWFVLGGIMFGLTLAGLRYKLRIFEAVEALTVGLLPWLGLFYLKDSIDHSSLFSFLAFFAVTSLLALFSYLDSHYKNFSWYKSGRIGFAGLTTLGLFFLIRGVFASFFPFVISFLGRYEAMISGVSAFVLFLLTFNLARKT